MDWWNHNEVDHKTQIDQNLSQMYPRMAQMDFHLWLHMRAHLKSVFLRYEPSVSNRKLKNTYDMLLYYLGPDNLTVADDTILKFLKEIDLYTKI